MGHFDMSNCTQETRETYWLLQQNITEYKLCLWKESHTTIKFWLSANILNLMNGLLWIHTTVFNDALFTIYWWETALDTCILLLSRSSEKPQVITYNDEAFFTSHFKGMCEIARHRTAVSLQIWLLFLFLTELPVSSRINLNSF